MGHDSPQMFLRYTTISDDDVTEAFGTDKKFDSAEEPPFLFLIGANNAFDSNTKVAIDKYSSTLILTREK